MRRLLPLFAAIGLAACQPTGEDTRATASTAAPATRSIYVLRLSPWGDTAVPLARFEGAFAVENGCLVFRMGETTFLPGFATPGDVRATSETVSIGERTLRLGQRTTLSGAQLSQAELALVASPPPRECSWPVLRMN